MHVPLEIVFIVTKDLVCLFNCPDLDRTMSKDDSEGAAAVANITSVESRIGGMLSSDTGFRLKNTCSNLVH